MQAFLTVSQHLLIDTRERCLRTLLSAFSWPAKSSARDAARREVERAWYRNETQKRWARVSESPSYDERSGDCEFRVVATVVATQSSQSRICKGRAREIKRAFSARRV